MGGTGQRWNDMAASVFYLCWLTDPLYCRVWPGVKRLTWTARPPPEGRDHFCSAPRPACEAEGDFAGRSRRRVTSLTVPRYRRSNRRSSNSRTKIKPASEVMRDP